MNFEIDVVNDEWKIMRDGETTIGYVQTKKNKTYIFDNEFTPVAIMDNKQTLNFSVLSALENNKPQDIELLIQYAYHLGVVDSMVMSKKDHEKSLEFVEKNANEKTEQMF